ncbi:protein of unknown function [Taphrina deformans PYCC 5710]|uniref:DNA replication checkpoint mediator MRC1 domain-containing protein n=1 Tax=Taphrina deformans (strain PYCC 5710 / ATCC 11124 / CBS 356.35 / IMI 108563 / JCM 9778 / NBRC 8474) TaxID=1097556 RepID=R4XNE3_TAPDE|nr:protein of unknown function [Taphrina deformans PYCC 5710]|eukprot:CCG84764.1 protein of unknown function [Taphrina deformans PYCC 5710]
MLARLDNSEDERDQLVPADDGIQCNPDTRPVVNEYESDNENPTTHETQKHNLGKNTQITGNLLEDSENNEHMQDCRQAAFVENHTRTWRAQPQTRTPKVLKDMHEAPAETDTDSEKDSVENEAYESITRLGVKRGTAQVTILPSVSQIMRDMYEDTDSDNEDKSKQAGYESEDAYERMRKSLLAQRRPTSSVTAAPEQDSDIELPGAGQIRKQAVGTITSRSKVKELAIRRRPLTSPGKSALGKTTLEQGKKSSAESDSEDIEAEIRMSSARRIPRRAANKKAIEAMHKETERLRRNMTLAPDASVKTKLHVNDFLSKIGYLRQPEKQVLEPESERPHHENSTPVLDDPFVEHDDTLICPQDTPTASTAALPLSKPFAAELEESDSDIELPSMARLVSSQSAPVPALPAEALQLKTCISIHEDVLLESDSDSEGEVLEHLRNHKLLFKKRDYEQVKKDRRAAKLVAMARPDSPTKQEARAAKARQAALIAQVSNQAKAERKAREATMLAAGVAVVSVEQRQREALEVEDLVEKARRQAMELRKLEEKEDRKRRAAEDGVNDISGDSENESEDHDWEAGEDLDVSSASETDDDDSSLDAENATNAVDQSILEKPKLGRHSSILSERRLSDEEEDHLSPIRRRTAFKKVRASRVVDDDSEEDKENAMPSPEATKAELGLTQFFEATPAVGEHHESNEFSASQFCLSPSIEVSRNMQLLRESDYVDHASLGEYLVPSAPKHQLQAIHDVIPSSQPELEAHGPQEGNTQFSLFDAPSPDESVKSFRLSASLQGQFTQATEVDGTQFPPRSTDSPQNRTAESTLVRLRKAGPSNYEKLTDATYAPDNVFKRMRREMDAEQHERSRKAFVDDRAVESDDEYAGLGGVSDEEVDDADEISAELADMIDDVADNDVDGQQKIAAFYAQKDLENDEKMVNTLMNDINNGGLRRKRGAGLLDMDDSEDEQEEEARYKARQAQMRARLLEAQNLTSLADNPKTKAFIDALEDRPVSANYIEIAGEDDVVQDIVPETQTGADDAEASSTPALLQRTDTVLDDESTQADVQMKPPSRPFKRPAKRITQSDIRKELSFLCEDDDDSQGSHAFDPSFVPTLKRERSSLTIEDRSTLSREDSQTWCDPRTTPQRENSMYSQLAASRSAETLSANAPVTVVVSKGHQLASRMATKAVNYHAKAAQAMREGRQKVQESKVRKKGGGMGRRDNKQDVLKLFA